MVSLRFIRPREEHEKAGKVHFMGEDVADAHCFPVVGSLVNLVESHVRMHRGRKGTTLESEVASLQFGILVDTPQNLATSLQAFKGTFNSSLSNLDQSPSSDSRWPSYSSQSTLSRFPE